jgi:hypothetical protein
MMRRRLRHVTVLTPEFAKYQIPSTKLQTNLKFQYSMTKTGLEFGILVIVIYL